MTTIKDQPVTGNEQQVSGNEQQVSGNEQTPTVTDHVITALCEFYQPEGETESLELKTTMDLIDEISAIADIEKRDISAAMETAGFKLKYTEAGMYWKLFKK